ncbi:hypothetical protein ABPG75_001321 [Micractinium tetrahymenae]
MAAEVLVETVIPAIAVVIFLTMAASPTRTVWCTRKRSDIGEFNPLPTVVLVANACVWSVFGALTADPFVFTGGAGAVLISTFNLFILSGQARQQTRDRLLALLLVYLFVILLMAALTALVPLRHSTAKTLWGVAANVGSVLYYTSPLATVRKVIRTKDSASIHLGNSAWGVVNCILWIAYFIAKGDYVVPTSTYYLGAFFNLVCLFLCWRFPRHKHDGQELAQEAEMAEGRPDSHASGPGSHAPGLGRSSGGSVSIRLGRTSSSGLSMRSNREAAAAGGAQPEGAPAVVRVPSKQGMSMPRARGHHAAPPALAGLQAGPAGPAGPAVQLDVGHLAVHGHTNPALDPAGEAEEAGDMPPHTPSSAYAIDRAASGFGGSLGDAAGVSENAQETV